MVSLWWCSCGGVLAVVFLCFCGSVFAVVLLWWCFPTTQPVGCQPVATASFQCSIFAALSGCAFNTFCSMLSL